MDPESVLPDLAIVAMSVRRTEQRKVRLFRSMWIPGVFRVDPDSATQQCQMSGSRPVKFYGQQVS